MKNYFVFLFCAVFLFLASSQVFGQTQSCGCKRNGADFSSTEWGVSKDECEKKGKTTYSYLCTNRDIAMPSINLGSGLSVPGTGLVNSFRSIVNGVNSINQPCETASEDRSSGVVSSILPKICKTDDDCPGAYDKCVPKQGDKLQRKICVYKPQACSTTSDCKSGAHYCVISASGSGYCSESKPVSCKSGAELEKDIVMCRVSCKGIGAGGIRRRCVTVKDRCYQCDENNRCSEKPTSRYVCI